MKKIIVLATIAITLFSCHPSRQRDGQISFRLKDIHQQDYYYKVHIAYPLIESYWSNCRFEDTFNREMTSFADSTMAEFQGEQLAEKKQVVDQVRGESPNPRPDYRYEMSLTHQWFNIYNGMLSLRFKKYEYALGAHGNTWFICYNFSASENRFLSTNDIIDRSTPEKLQELAELISQYLDNPGDCFAVTADELDNDFENVNFTNDNIIFSFANYQIGPYACGTAVVHIPIDVLKKTDLIQPDFLKMLHPKD